MRTQEPDSSVYRTSSGHAIEENPLTNDYAICYDYRQIERLKSWRSPMKRTEQMVLVGSDGSGAFDHGAGEFG